MDNKLERFFNAINFNKDYYSFFNNASVEDVLLIKKINRLTLIIKLDKSLPLTILNLKVLIQLDLNLILKKMITILKIIFTIILIY